MNGSFFAGKRDRNRRLLTSEISISSSDPADAAAKICPWASNLALSVPGLDMLTANQIASLTSGAHITNDY